MSKQTVLKEFQKIPGVGRSIAEDLYYLGFKSVAELKGRNPEKIYTALCKKNGAKIDRCMLYVFRCAVYYSTKKKHNPELLKWWNWKD